MKRSAAYWEARTRAYEKLLARCFIALRPFAQFARVMEAQEKKIRAARNSRNGSYGDVIYGITFSTGEADLRRSDCRRALKLRKVIESSVIRNGEPRPRATLPSAALAASPKPGVDRPRTRAPSSPSTRSAP